MKSNVDLDLLDELIKKCEAKMAMPFKKKKEESSEMMMAEGSEEEDSEEDPKAAVIIAKKEEPASMEDSEDMDALLELYKKIKA